MTSKEAIRVLEDNRPSVIFEDKDAQKRMAELCKAIDMAIEALSQPIVAKHFDIQSGYIYCSPQIAENVKVVVRCKDCRYYKKINPKAKSGMCYKDIVASAWNDDGFCSRGERKGGDTE